MGNVERVDKTLPLNDFVYYVRKDARLRERWKSDLQTLAKEFHLSTMEYEALRDPDPRQLMDMGVHQYLVPHILRLTHGVSGFTNTHPAMLAYQRAFPREAKAAIGNTKWDRTGREGG